MGNYQEIIEGMEILISINIKITTIVKLDFK
jgi:hypothetical protein